jgi:hypothetical protein
MSISVFAADHDKVWSYRYACTLEMYHLSGGVPNDPKVITGWLRSRLALDKKGERDEQLAALVEQTAKERGVSFDEAIHDVQPNVNGFKRDAGGLVFEGRNVKAAIKEFTNIALAGGHFHTMKDGKKVAPRWGATGKGVTAFVAEHIQVPDVLIPICDLDGKQFTEPDIPAEQRFVSTFRGQSISYTDAIDQSTMSFTVEADWDFDSEWPIIWSIGESNGIGAMRSQGSGKFVVTEWRRLGEATEKKPRKRV